MVLHLIRIGSHELLLLLAQIERISSVGLGSRTKHLSECLVRRLLSLLICGLLGRYGGLLVSLEDIVEDVAGVVLA